MYCPDQRRSIEPTGCKPCAKAHEVTAQTVVCTPDAPEVAPRDTAAGTTSGETVCVHGDVPCRLLATVASEDPWSLPVVDDAGRFIGFVTSGQFRPSRHVRAWSASDTPARRVTTGSVLAIHEAKPVRTALRIMAHHGSRLIAIVDDDGVLRGTLSDIQALRALGRR